MIPSTANGGRARQPLTNGSKNATRDPKSDERASSSTALLGDLERTTAYRESATRQSSASVVCDNGREVQVYSIATDGAATPPAVPLLRETLFLNSWAKFRLFKRFPTGFSLNFTLLLIITFQTYIYYHHDVRRASSVLYHFSELLNDVEGTFENRQAVLDTPAKLQRHVFRSISNGNKVKELSIESYKVTKFWEATFFYRNDSIMQTQLLPAQCESPELLAKALPEIFNLTVLPYIGSFHLNIQYNDQFIAHKEPGCWNWDLVEVCDGEGGGHFVCRLDYVITDCADQVYFSWLSHLLVFCLATLSLLQIIKKCRHTYAVFLTLQERSPTWQTLSAKEKVCIINMWWPFTILTNVVEICVALQSTQCNQNVAYRLRGTGFAIFLSYINIIQYFEHYGSFHVLFCTLLRAIPQVAKFLLCIFPVLCAFAFLGVMFFWPVHWFSTPSMAFCTLYSLLNGDVLHDSFLNLQDVNATFAHFYLYSFLCFFICVVLNVNITIIGEAFLKAQKYDQVEGYPNYRRHSSSSTETTRIQQACRSRDHSPCRHPLSSDRQAVLASYMTTFDKRHFPRLAPAMLRALDEIDPAADSQSEEEPWALDSLRLISRTHVKELEERDDGNGGVIIPSSRRDIEYSTHSCPPLY
eukprot:GEMP01025785.1.p1 GENE.GEMP01025785.1~~GEMP01025785.1.p1  ORF type:complete len:640 (+),score=104.64 GEMP01025785.1:117-2036(+)